MKGLEEHENYNEWKEKVPAFRCGINFFVTTNYNTPKKYDELLRCVDSQFGINCHSIVVGYRTGYGQVLVEPIGWAGDWTADLLPIYGANIRAFNKMMLMSNFSNTILKK